jgi:nucleoside-diphosphate-sugar epimerase
VSISATIVVRSTPSRAAACPWPPSSAEPVGAARTAIGSLLTVFEAAQTWGVERVGVASTIGVYAGAPGPSPYREDTPLPMTAGHVIPAFKKIGELLTDHLAGATGLGPAEAVHLDITRLRDDTGYRPAYDTGQAVADYVGWLRAGHER